MQKTKVRVRKAKKNEEEKNLIQKQRKAKRFSPFVFWKCHIVHTLSCPDETTGGLRDKSLVAYGSLKRKYNGT